MPREYPYIERATKIFQAFLANRTYTVHELARECEIDYHAAWRWMASLSHSKVIEPKENRLVETKRAGPRHQTAFGLVRRSA